jgi:hypothetical protein
MEKQTQKLEHLQYLLRECEKNLSHAQQVINEISGKEPPSKGAQIDPEHFKVDRYPTGEDIVEGIFDGYQMIGPDETVYPVPENYASKSKLVKGDRLKLTITPQGRFIYKQIGPAPRETKRGILIYHEEDDEFGVSSEGFEYKVLKASVTYYKGEPGDEVVILVPEGEKSNWAAVDNIVKDLPALEKMLEIEDRVNGDTENSELEEI